MDVRGRRAAVARGFVSIRRSTAASLEVGAIVALVIGVWWLALGWDWAIAQTPLHWLALAIVAVAAVGWLALRGRGVLGFVVVCVPVAVLSGWRLAAAEVVDWPSQVAALIFGLSVTCMPAALVGWWLRRRVNVVGIDSESQRVIRPRVAEPDDEADSNVPDSVPKDDEPDGAEAAALPPDSAEAAAVQRDGAEVAGLLPDGAEPGDDVHDANGETRDD